MKYFKNLFKAIFNIKEKEQEERYNAPMSSNSEMDDKYLVDFRHGGTFISGTTGTISLTSSGDSERRRKLVSFDSTEPQKITVKPKDVFEELERTPTMWSLENLDDKIEIMKDKAKLVSQYHTKRELEDFISRLEHRKKLREKDKDKKTFLSYFQQFDTTTDEKIQALLKKYNLVMENADIFIPEFPDEAVKIMKTFSRKVERVTGKKPIYYVIAEESNFKKKYERRDPILLGQSPFGFYYHILGAWDTEMIYLPEL